MYGYVLYITLHMRHSLLLSGRNLGRDDFDILDEKNYLCSP